MAEEGRGGGRGHPVRGKNVAGQYRALFAKGLMRSATNSKGKRRVIYSRHGEKHLGSRAGRLLGAARQLSKFEHGERGQGLIHAIDATARARSEHKPGFFTRQAASARRLVGIKPKKADQLVNRLGGHTLRYRLGESHDKTRRLAQEAGRPRVEHAGSIARRLKRADTPDLFGGSRLTQKASAHSLRIQGALRNPNLSEHARRRAKQYLKAYGDLT
ncbi:hypothetical protein [Deinococcus wulumuqiensis]|uniref:Uncharacterized protein n=1 Tax=Deinococcus wulumuqiensis TaxID=980427 RepID=A0AAV4K6F2_9DEIO|nr:hypothetical protein [Deinococcus wulumuqiensis]QII20041.1 hypothetical protein G6R31_04145 [Deinococcus wulumuqiensis R12]GGI87184.1 hypothetical protein GCM10010914_22040 [Deinococcus wulumuqiensis]GGP29977.1 hypothetical protein GCM10008021_16280 [Deinococcus wulumuqiensis]